MPGKNTLGTPKTEDYNLGRGILYFAELDSSGMPDGYRDLGNAPEFNLSIEKEELEHRSAREGLKTVDKTVVISQDLAFSFQLEELNHENLAALFSGETADHTNVAIAGFTKQTAMITDVVLGRWYDIVNSSGERAYDISTADLTLEVGATSLVENTDYTLDLTMGRIFFLSTASNATAGDEIDATLTAKAGAKTVSEVQGLTKSSVTGALKFISENPANADHNTEYQFHKITLSSEGDFSLIGDEFSTMPFTGTAQKNADADADSPTLTIRDLD